MPEAEEHFDSGTQSDDGSTDMSDSHEPLEVLFDGSSPLRRRASLTQNNNKKLRRAGSERTSTSCFVHALLEQQRQDSDVSLNSEANTPTVASVNAKRDSEASSSSGSKPSNKGSNTPPNADTQSRLLTKKQLSDMAFEIRELSKRLGHLRLRLKVRNVFILTKVHDEDLISKSRSIVKWLLDSDHDNGVPYTAWVEDRLRDDEVFDAKTLHNDDESRKSRLQYWTNELCRKRPHTFDIVVALGGDGTVLYASSLFQRVVPPVLSFAMGSLGFLTKFDFDVFPKTLSRAFSEGVTISLRIRFEGTVMRAVPHDQQCIETTCEGAPVRADNTCSKERKNRHLVDELIGSEQDNAYTHRPIKTVNILNEIVLDRGPNATMSSIEVFGDDKHFTTVQADGICVATPTGSTAYNLAAGGSLCHPENPVILLTAICAHTLNFRPIILPDTIVLRVGVPYDARASSWASFDGRERTELMPGDYVTISASRFPYPSVMPLDRRSEDWIESISRTLNWNSREKQKAFSAG